MEASNTSSTLAQKEAMLLKAEAMVAELRNQVAVLRNAAKPSEFEALFAAQTPTTTAASPVTKLTATSIIKEIAMKTVSEKNEKGAVTNTILKVLADGQPKSVEQVMLAVNEMLDKPTTVGSMRGTLSNLKGANMVIKTAYGEYAIHPHKGESPTTEHSEAFNLQPSPTKGANTENLA